jgi:TolB-like protein
VEIAERNFFAELKRRNVVRMAGLYLVGAWLLVQVAGTILPMFGAPEWLPRTVVVLLAIGFVPVLIFSWAFELTPQGLKRDAEVAREESIAPRTGRRMDRMIIAVLLLALGYFAFDKFVLTRRAIAPPIPIVASVALPVPVATAISEKSVAVLPFENLSSDKENAYFAEGIQDEILTRLAKIAALKVISRTSTQKYKSAPDNLREVGLQLGVANLLEGSVQRAGNAVHINVQLIKAASDEHLWAESYDRELQNIFGVEGEVASTIADQLKAKLSGSEKESLAAVPTHNPAAYDAYLRGLAFAGRVDALRVNTLRSIESFEEAVRLDPQFAQAWAQLSRRESFMVSNLLDPSPQRKEAARKALKEAMRLGPELAETQLADGFYHYHVERDYDGAKKRFEAARRSYPNDPWPPYALGAICRRQGEWTKGIDLFTQAIALNPQDVFSLTDASSTNLAMRDVAGAQKLLARAHDLSPENAGVLVQQAVTYQMTGDLAHAKAVLEPVQSLNGDSNLMIAIVSTAILSRDYGRALALLKTQLETPQDLGTSLGAFQSSMGDLQRHGGDDNSARVTYAQARATLTAAVAQEPDNPNLLSGLAWTEACLGDKTASLAHARQAVAAMPASKDAWIGPAYEESLARVEAHFGDKESAIPAVQHLLGISYGTPPITTALLRLDPDWDNLRDDPRFEKLCQASP